MLFDLQLVPGPAGDPGPKGDPVSEATVFLLGFDSN